MLHIHPGECSADALRAGGVPGTVMVWSDVLTEGPLPLDVSPEAWRRARAGALRGDAPDGPTLPDLLDRLRRQDDALARSLDHDEVVLWFDACLYDQSILLRLLAGFSQRPLGSTVLSLICIGAYPGCDRFCGLGELSPAQLAGLLPERRPVSEAQLSAARACWRAYCGPDPRPLAALAAGGVPEFDYVAAALRRSLEELPWACDGLGRLERQVVQAIPAAGCDPLALFRTVSACEDHPFFGDTMLWRCVNRLAGAPDPAIAIDGPGPLPEWEPQQIRRWSLRRTALGDRLLSGEADWVRDHGVDRWNAGVHVQGHGPCWRWDAAQGRPVHGGGNLG